MIDRAVDAPGFTQDVLASIKSDQNGPQVDLRAALLAHLGNRISLVWGVAGSAEPWIVIHVANQKQVAKALVALFRNDPEAGPPHYFDGGVVIQLAARQNVDLQLDANNQPVDQDDRVFAHSIGVIDSQIVLATDNQALVDLAENRGRTAELRRNRALNSMIGKLQEEDATPTGRVVSLGGGLAVPAFISGSSQGQLTPPKTPARASAMNVQASEDGLVIEGFLFPGKSVGPP